MDTKRSRVIDGVTMPGTIFTGRYSMQDKEREHMHPTNNTARLAGVLYLVMGVPAVFSYQYVHHTLMVHGNAAATANNILASEMLFRMGIVSELISVIAFIFLVRALYRLLNAVDKGQASLMVTLVLLSIPISFLNVLNEIAALTLLRGADFLSLLDKPQRDSLAMLFLGLHGDGLNLATIFWGLWLFPFGVLVMRSGFIPRILGVLLIPNGLAWLVVSLTTLLFPTYLNVVNRFAIIPELGELWIMAWLLIKGVKVPLSAAPAS
jgi:hypothetical protein